MQWLLPQVKSEATLHWQGHMTLPSIHTQLYLHNKFAHFPSISILQSLFSMFSMFLGTFLAYFGEYSRCLSAVLALEKQQVVDDPRRT